MGPFGNDPADKTQIATSPDRLLENFVTALNDRDIELYENLLHNDFQSTACLSEELEENHRADELATVAELFETFTTIEADLSVENRPVVEARQNIDVRLKVLMVDEEANGFRVDLLISLSVNQVDDGTWRISRWLYHTAETDCESYVGWEFLELR